MIMPVYAGMNGAPLDVSLEVKADGQVMIDGEAVGWVVSYSVESRGNYPERGRGHWHEVELKFMVDSCEPGRLTVEMDRDVADTLAALASDFLHEPPFARPHNNNLRRTANHLKAAVAALKKELGL
jgi:hypothetical protein